VRLLRIVPDDTKFDFMRFRRISFPLSALLSIIAISLWRMSKVGAADLKERLTRALGLGEVQLQQFGAPNDVLIRTQSSRGETAQQAVRVRATRVTKSSTDASRLLARASPASFCPTALSV
jgi:preprotein translocase subunit SecF